MAFGEVRALDGASFAVEQGEIFGLLGHNGAGKTTLIRVVNGLLRPTAGRVRTFGETPDTHGESVRARTGVLTEYPALDSFLSVFENVLIHAQIHDLSMDVARQRTLDLLERLELTEHTRKRAHELSAGLKQRVALARALVHDPDLLLLDEPTSNLDPIAARDVRELVRELARERGKTVLLSTHNLNEAQHLCDRLGIIEHGHMLAVGSMSQLSGRLQTGRVRIALGVEDLVAGARVIESHTGRPPEVAGHVLITSVQQDQVPRMVALLVEAGCALHAVVPEQPTLEEVYVSLHANRTGMQAGVGAA